MIKYKTLYFFLYQSGLHPTAEAPYLFRDWMRKMLRDWSFENICCAHMGVKVGGANAAVASLLDKAEPLFAKLSEKNNKKNPGGELPPGNHPNMNVSGDECDCFISSFLNK